MAVWELLFSEFLYSAAARILLGYVALGILLTSLALVMLLTYGPLLRANLSVWYHGSNPLPPGTMGLPFWGESDDYVRLHSDSRNPDAWFDAKRAKYGNVFKTHILGNPTIVFLGAEGNKFVLQNDKAVFDTSWPPSSRKIFGPNSVSMTTGTQHRKLRTALSQFACPEALRARVGYLESLCVKHLDKYWEGIDELKVYDNMVTFSFSIAADVFMAFDSDFVKEQFKGLFPFINAGLISVPLNLPWTKFGKGYKASKAAKRIIHDEIQRRRKMIAGGQTKLSASNLEAAKDLMDFLIVWEGEQFGLGKATDQEIAENMITMLIAGYDTTASTLTVIIQNLASHPVILAKLRHECKKVAESKGAGESLTMAEVKNMEYMRRVIDEGLRIVPAVPGFFKRVPCTVEYQGFTIPKGWTAYISTRSTLTKDEYFSNPNEFNPDRFKGKRPDTFAFIPFGQGFRMCAGMDLAKLEIHLLLYHLVLRYDLELINPNEQFTMFWFPTPKEGLPVRITPVEK